MNRRGFTLLELLIALGITSVVIAGISIILVKQSQASVKQTQQRSLEENGRQALLEIAYSVRMAGAGIDPTAAFDFDRYACGTPGTASSCNGSGRDRNDAPDELVVSYRDPSFSRAVTSQTGTDPYTVNIDRPLTVPLEANRIVLLLCSGADPVAYTAVQTTAPVGASQLTLRSLQPRDGYYSPTPTGTLEGCFSAAAMV